VIFRGGRPVVGFGDVPCPSNPAPPSGYAIWKGPVPPELTQWAIAIRDHIGSYPYGQQFTMNWAGSTVLARKDHHTWTYVRQPDGSVQLRTGICIPGVTLYRPQTSTVSGLGADATDPGATAPDPDLALFSVSSVAPPERTDWGLVVLSAGAAVVVAGLFVWGLHAVGER
jgi:hypothetical protein